ncbi:MAG: ABC transporter permease, partial [Planctomycetota bacterium]
MGSYIVRRLAQAVFTIFGVMVLTFLLFHLTPRDVANTYVDQSKQGKQAVDDWKAKHHMDLPVLVNTSEGWNPFDGKFYDSQFFHHLGKSVTFSGYSFQYPERTLLDIIAQRAKFSLALTIPQLGLGWMFGLIIASIVAFYRGRFIDNFGVFLAVLGMCIPYLAYIILVQYFMFQLNPEIAFGTGNFYNIYIPVGIGVLAGLGGSVRFYRTIILDQVNQDYVRTARAKGVPLPSILGKHVLRNCMLPILTSL